MGMTSVATLAAAASAIANFASTAPLPLSPPPSNSTGVSALVPTIQGWVNSFAVNAAVVTSTMDNAALDIGKAAFVFLVIAGVLLWFSHVDRRLGKELFKGGVVIGLFIEFVVPFLLTIHLS